MVFRCRVDKLKSDMILNENIYDDEHVLLLSRGTVLTVGNINTIKKLGLMEISVGRGDEKPRPVLLQRLDPVRVQKFQTGYNKTKDEFNGLLKHISAGHVVNIEAAYSLPGSLLTGIGALENLFAYLNHVNGLDDHTMGHSINVSLICSVICKWFSLDHETSKITVVAGLMHDVGKSLVPPEILNKPGSLSPAEWAEIKKHPIYGYRILKKARLPEHLLVGALMHHEREDGSGYPLGLNREKIPLAARIIAVADIYDAMTSNRVYRRRLCPFEVIRQFQTDYLGVLDTGVLMEFLNRIAGCYVGEKVLLSDGRVGIVVYVNPREPARPIVQMADGWVNLAEKTELAVESVISA